MVETALQDGSKVDLFTKEPRQTRSPRNLSPNRSQEKDVLTARARRLMFAFTVIAVCLRVDIFRRILGYRQCTTPGIEVSYIKISTLFSRR